MVGMGGYRNTLGSDGFIGASIGALAGMAFGGEAEIMAGSMAGGLAAEYVTARYSPRERVEEAVDSYDLDTAASLLR